MQENTEKTCVLLSTYNGEKYLEEQLDSLICQEGTAPTIIIRDDGSSDYTAAILEQYKQKYPDRIELLESTGNLRVAGSFVTLTKYAVGQKYDYYFFCDQDDFWKPDKCRRAVDSIREAGRDALYFSRKSIVDSSLNPIGTDVVNDHGTFWDCFEHSNASGCTMCFNRALAEKLVMNDFKEKRYIHDAFLYRLAIVIEAVIVYDDYESILYRQHSNNAIGAIGKKKITKLLTKKAMINRTHYMQDLFRDLLDLYPNSIPEKNKKTIQMIAQYKSPYSRLEFTAKLMLSDCPKKIKRKLAVKAMAGIL